MNLLELKDVTKQFGGLTAVDRLSLSMEKGEILGVIGPNGAGKSTAFNCIAGVFPPTKGEVVFDGHDDQWAKALGSVQKRDCPYISDRETLCV